MTIIGLRASATRQRALIGTSFIAIGFGLALPAQAQTLATTGVTALEEIFVTARRVEENLQEVPVAVTAFSGTQLERQGVTQLRDVAAFTPGLSTRESPNNPTSFILALRGQVQTDNLATLEPSVGTYLDGLYLARAYGLNSDLVDVRSVQVLKGPQGTLFGLNATGGALLIETNDPQMGEVSGMLQVRYGRFSDASGTAVVNLPIRGSLAVRGALRLGDSKGYIKDINTGERHNGRDTVQGRLKLLAEPTDNVRIVLSGEWWDSKIDGPVRINRYGGPTWTGAAGAIFAAETPIIRGTPDLAAVSPLSPSAGPNARRGAYTDAETQTYTGTVTADWGTSQLKWISGYRRYLGDNEVDLDGTSFARHWTQAFQVLKQYSTELLLTGAAGDGKLDYAVGATYFEENGFDRSRSTGNNGTSWTAFNGIIDNQSVAVYAQGSYHLNDKLSLLAGLRYSKDDKGVTTQSGVFLNNVTLFVCLPTIVPTSTNCLRSREDSFASVSYTLGLDYRLSEYVLIYAKTSKGYRSGAQQLRSLTLFDTEPAEPEIVHEQEVGLKSEFMDRRVRFNAAGYYNEISGAQRNVLQAVGGVAQTLLENADIRNYGVEADLTARVGSGLTLVATGSINDAKYQKYVGYIAGVFGFDKTGNRISGLAKYQFSFAANYETDLDFGRLSANVNYA